MRPPSRWPPPSETGLPVIVSFAFESGKNKDRTMTGVTPEQAARRMTAEGADAVGANCGVGIVEYIPSLPTAARRDIAAALDQSERGLAGDGRSGTLVYRTGPEQFAALLPDAGPRPGAGLRRRLLRYLLPSSSGPAARALAASCD